MSLYYFQTVLRYKYYALSLSVLEHMSETSRSFYKYKLTLIIIPDFFPATLSTIKLSYNRVLYY